MLCQTQTRRLTYFGHVTRMEKNRYFSIDIQLRVIELARGRPKKRWLDNIREDCVEMSLSICLATQLAEDTVKWRNTVRNRGCRSARILSSSPRL